MNAQYVTHNCPRCETPTASRFDLCEACDQASRTHAWGGFRPGLRANELPWHLKLLSGLLSAGLALMLLVALVRNPGMDEYQAWYGLRMAQSAMQQPTSIGQATDAFGAVIGTAAIPALTRRDNLVFFSVFTTQWPGGETVRTLGFSGRFYPLR